MTECYIKAIFKPRRIEDLKHGYEKLLHKTLTLQYGWIIEEGMYTGQIAFLNAGLEKVHGWIPRRRFNYN